MEIGEIIEAIDRLDAKLDDFEARLIVRIDWKIDGLRSTVSEELEQKGSRHGKHCR